MHPTQTTTPPQLRRPGQSRRASLLRSAGLAACLALLMATLLASLRIGARPVPTRELWEALFGHAPEGSPAELVMQLRGPRTLIGLAAGIGLGVSGALAQALTRNPLADPGILGTTSGAAFAVALAAGLTGLHSPVALLVTAFCGAAVTTLGVHAIGALGRGGAGPVQLVLAGTAVGAVLAGITQAIILSDRERFAVMQAWRAGSLADRTSTGLLPAAVFLLVGLTLAALVSSSLNTIALGDDLASSLGVNVALTRTLGIIAVALLAGTATALAGPIAFVGLVVPHLTRWANGPDQRWIMAFSTLLGPTLLLAADIIGRIAMPPGELPAGVVTAFVGAPFLIALVRRRELSEL